MFPRPLKSTLYFTLGTVFGLLLAIVLQSVAKKASDLLLQEKRLVTITPTHPEKPVPTGPTPTPRPKRPLSVHDPKEHDDDYTIANNLHENVRVLIWVMTEPNSVKTKAVHVKKTWGRRANVLLFVSDVPDENLPAIGLNISHGREHLTMKTMRAFQYVYENHINDADWFMKVDDDTFVVVENLRYLLSNYSEDSPIYFGHHFVKIVKQGYFSGGGGYVLSKEALRRFGQRPVGLCANDSGAEDVEMGRCMEALNVTIGESNDEYGRSRFHALNLDDHLFSNYPDWYYDYDKHQGQEDVSDYPITFHYVDSYHMYAMEYYTYHLRPYGIQHKTKVTNENSLFTTTGPPPPTTTTTAAAANKITNQNSMLKPTADPSSLFLKTRQHILRKRKTKRRKSGKLQKRLRLATKAHQGEILGRTQNEHHLIANH